MFVYLSFVCVLRQPPCTRAVTVTRACLLARVCKYVCAYVCIFAEVCVCVSVQVSMLYTRFRWCLWLWRVFTLVPRSMFCFFLAEQCWKMNIDGIFVIVVPSKLSPPVPCFLLHKCPSLQMSRNVGSLPKISGPPQVLICVLRFHFVAFTLYPADDKRRLCRVTSILPRTVFRTQLTPMTKHTARATPPCQRYPSPVPRWALFARRQTSPRL